MSRALRGLGGCENYTVFTCNREGQVAPIYAKCSVAQLLIEKRICFGTFCLQDASGLLGASRCLLDAPGCLLGAFWVPSGCLLDAPRCLLKMPPPWCLLHDASQDASSKMPPPDASSMMPPPRCLLQMPPPRELLKNCLGSRAGVIYIYIYSFFVLCASLPVEANSG